MPPLLRPPLLRPPLLATVAAVAAAALVLVAAPRTADACSPWPCNWDGYFVPGDGATVPANLPAIYWRPRGDVGEPDPTLVTLSTAADPSTPLPYTATRIGDGRDYLLVPGAALVPGTQYVLTDGNACNESSSGEPGPRVTFTAGPTAPLPTGLGAMAVTNLPTRSETLSTASGSCWISVTTISAAMAIDYATASDAAPWRDVLHFATFVDGQRWSARSSILQTVAPGASWEERGADRLVAVCSYDVDVPPGSSPPSGFGVPEGEHQVEMRATLPGTDLALATEPEDVLLRCPPVLPGDDEATDDGGGCSSSTHPGAAAGLALIVVLAVARSARRPRRRATAP